MDIQAEHGTQPIDKYWLELSDLTIYEAAFWMVTGSDPLDHEKRCMQDEIYENHFHDRYEVSEAVEEGREVIISAIRCGLIKTTEDVRSDNGTLTSRTHIRKTDWISWCRDNGYTELANRFGHAREGNDSIAAKAKVAPEIMPSNEGWMAQARAIADECFDRDTANKCRDSLRNYSTRVMEAMQERGIKGPRGIHTNPRTIMRDALQGKKWWANKPK